jgi:hypothetical protein
MEDFEQMTESLRFATGLLVVSYRDKSKTATRCTLQEGLGIQQLPLSDILKFEWTTLEEDI